MDYDGILRCIEVNVNCDYIFLCVGGFVVLFCYFRLRINGLNGNLFKILR